MTGPFQQSVGWVTRTEEDMKRCLVSKPEGLTPHGPCLSVGWFIPVVAEGSTGLCSVFCSVWKLDQKAPCPSLSLTC